MRTASVFAILGLGLLPTGDARAQERPPEQTKNEPGRYFARPLDLWKAGLSYGPAPRPSGEAEPLPPRVALRESVWAQPIRTPDGTWMIYVPPRQVLDFLESPSEETAKAYLHWKQVQAEKLKKAMELLAQVKEPVSPAPPPDATLPASAALAPPATPEKITYFKRPTCPHCATQDAVLEEWLKARPGVTLEVVLPQERPDLWKAYAVRGTPTLVVQGGSGAPDVLVGLQAASTLDAVLTRRTRGKEGPDPLPQKEIAR